MALADTQARRAIPTALAMTLERVTAEGITTLERYRNGVSYLHSNYGFLDKVGDQMLYGLTYVLVSDNREYVAAVAEAIGKEIKTEL